MKWENKNVFITGVNGFVGSYLAEALINKGANVFGLIRSNNTSKIKNLSSRNILDRVSLIEGNLLDNDSLNNAFKVSSPDFTFHLAAQSFVPRSFENPVETQEINGLGTSNLLNSVISEEVDTKVVFAGSSEEYGLVFFSEEQYEATKKKYGDVTPCPESFPELPISESNSLRPMSPYAVSKVYGDFLMRDYYHSYGLNTVVSRAFNHEGSGRGLMFVSSIITNQVMKLKNNNANKITIGNVNAFRDWSHIGDIVNGYIKLAENGESGGVYNQGSMRTNSVLTYILLSLEGAGFPIDKIETFNSEKVVKNPTEVNNSKLFGIKFKKTLVDKLMLDEGLNFNLKDKGIVVYSGHNKIKIEFDKSRFRPSDVPVILSDTSKIQKIGFKCSFGLKDIINEQLNYFSKK